MRSFFLACIVLLPLMVSAQAPGTVSGRLVVHGTISADTHIKLVKDPSREVVAESTTDSNGYFTLTGIPNGTFTLIYVDTNGKDVVAYTDLRNSSRIDPTSAINETVTISSTTAQTVDEVSKTVNSIDGQEMRDRADFSLVDTIRSIPGFRVQQLGGFGRTANIKTRGLRNQDTAILIDGIRFRDPSAITGDASPFLSDFTLANVSSIEVLRGSGSSLYGTNAIGGTIDFRTPRPLSGFHGGVLGELGGLGLKR